MAAYGLEAAAVIPPNAMLSGWLDPWPSPFHKAVECSGYGGVGVDWPLILTLWPSIILFLVFHVVGHVLKKSVIPKLGVALGLPESMAPSGAVAMRNRKFAHQVWLFLFYSANTCFGYYAQRGRSWFAIPVSFDNVRMMFSDFPAQPDEWITLHFCTGIAFYSLDMVNLFVEERRTDFAEYMVHHVATMVLLVMTFSGHDHAMGSYVMFIHDASDVFLCLAKAFHYVRYEKVVACCFGIFTIGFVFFRFVCFPICIIGCFYISPLMRKATINFYVLAFLLVFGLLLLHVYWFALILRTVHRLLRGVKGDARSESDNDETELKSKKGQHHKPQPLDIKFGHRPSAV